MVKEIEETAEWVPIRQVEVGRAGKIVYRAVETPGRSECMEIAGSQVLGSPAVGMAAFGRVSPRMADNLVVAGRFGED